MEQIYSIDQAAEQLGISGRRARQLVNDGILAATRISGVYVVTAAQIAAARARKTRPGPPITTGAGARRKDRQNPKLPPQTP